LSKSKDGIKWIELYRNKTGKKEIDMHEVARFALANGYEPPKPKTIEEVVARQLSRAARQHHKTDPDTGEPYRVNHRIPGEKGQASIWINVDDGPPRNKMLISLSTRREQMVGDALQLTRDADRWNRVCPDQEPIQLPLDLTFDVELRRHADEDDAEELAS